MSELITTYNLDDLDQSFPMNRDEFYSSQIKVFKEKGKPTKAVEVVLVLLFSPEKELLLQKRSKKKSHNPGMMDKTMGGHITFGNSPNYTVMTETLQELSVPSFVLSSREDFEKTYDLLKDYTNNSAIIQLIDSRTYNSKKIINKEVVVIANKYHFYLGIYNGSIKPADKEVTGVLFYDYESFLEELTDTPDYFTYDLRFLVSKYDKQINGFLAKLGDKNSTQFSIDSNHIL